MGVLVLLSLILAFAPTRASSSDEGNSAELRRMSQELYDALAPGNVAVWERYLDERFVHLDENGVVRSKVEFLEEVKPLPPGLVGRIEIDHFETTFHGSTAVVACEMQEYLEYHGQSLRTRFRSLDTWLLTSDGWRLIGGHLAAVLRDPPAVTLARETLSEYEGVYRLTPEIETRIQRQGTGLTAQRDGRPPVPYSAEIRDVFFAPAQPRSRRIFTRDASGRVDGFVDRREGEDIRWTKAMAADGR
jgi:hypothetical protein